LIMMISFVAWKMPEGATFPEIGSSESLVARFATLWYTNKISKKW